MSEMIERVAKAIARKEYTDPLIFKWDECPSDLKEFFRDIARAAIEAMREPTDEMKKCNEEVHWGYSCHVCGGLTEGWYAMIDAALGRKAAP